MDSDTIRLILSLVIFFLVATLTLVSWTMDKLEPKKGCCSCSVKM